VYTALIGVLYHGLLQGIEADDQFTFNDEFTSKFKRIKVPLISAKEISSHDGSAGGEGGNGGDAGGGDGLGGEALPAAVEEERRHHVEAAIVRIMKSRKTLSHNELVMETTRQLSMRFTPNPQVCLHLCESFKLLAGFWMYFEDPHIPS
jgi:cullin 3